MGDYEIEDLDLKKKLIDKTIVIIESNKKEIISLS